MRTVRIILVLGLALQGLPISAFAIAPRHQSDLELSRYPIIVVGTWDKPPFRPHELVEGNVCREFEVFTGLNVHRVIKGDIKPGKQVIMFGWGVAWLKDGTRLGTWTSTEIPGDVADVTKSNIWFLNTKRSWDESDTTLYYHLPHYRAVQPLVLEPYFAAIGSDYRDKEVPKQLSSDNHLVLERALRYICGDVWPWPNDPERFATMYSNPTERGKVLKDQAALVRDVVTRDVGDVRALAASAYAELAGKDSVGFMRTLLTDKDADVRATAIGILAKHRDEASIDAMAQAVVGVDDGRMACRVIDTLSSWGDRRLVPILVTFLQNNRFAYQYGDDLGIPALQSRKAIAEITGHWFPYDVAASAKAWKEVNDIEDPRRQKELLQRLLPGSQFPVVAELIGSPRHKAQQPGDGPSPNVEATVTADHGPFDACGSAEAMVTVRVRNSTNQNVVIAKIPTEYDQSWPSCVCSRKLGSSEGETKDAFVSLRPAESVRFEVSLDGGFLLADPDSRTLNLTYRNNGNSAGVNAWIGVLEAKFGAEWKEERKLEEVKERWPNGNLKAVGQTVNDQQYGEWNYFNEEGDRIRIVNYSGGHGEATCNPEHPSNKGAGRKDP